MRKAFTLVELLVVIGIIALLISILLPAMARVRRQVRITNCISNQRQLLQAAFMYASDNGGALPIPQRPANYSISGWEPLLSVFQSDLSTTAVTLVKKSPDDWGVLHQFDYMKDPRVAYEVDSQNPQCVYDTYRQSTGWGALPNDVTRSGYYLNPHAIVSLRRPLVYARINSQYGIQTGLGQMLEAGKKPEFPFDALTMDRPSLGDSRKTHGYTWNIGFMDGSVRSYVSDKAVQLINNYDGTAKTAVWQNWTLHENFLKALTAN